jgi:hypothetical protein
VAALAVGGIQVVMHDLIVAEPIACGAATHALLAPAAPPCGALTLTLTLTLTLARVGC